MDLVELLQQLAGTKPSVKSLERTDIDGLIVLTVSSSVYGFQTTIHDAAGVIYTVEKYPMESAAREGHAKWMVQIRNGLRNVDTLMNPDGPARKGVRLLRESDFEGPRDIPAESIEVTQQPFLASAPTVVHIRGEKIVEGSVQFVQGYLRMLTHRVIGAESVSEALAAQKGQPVAPTTTIPEGVVACRRVMDFKKGPPTNYEIEQCSECLALIAYNPEKLEAVGQTKLCRQCAGIGDSATTH